MIKHFLKVNNEESSPKGELGNYKTTVLSKKKGEGAGKVLQEHRYRPNIEMSMLYL